MVPIRPDVASAFRILYLGSLIPFTRLHWDLGRHVKLLVLRLERINHPVFRPIPQPDLWCLSLESCTVPPQVLESKIVMKSAFAIPLAFAICLALVNASASKPLHSSVTIPLRSDVYPSFAASSSNCCQGSVPKLHRW